MATIADVARTAGVAPSTVSYVLTGKRTISAETAQRVRTAIAELGYQPHAGARALAGARTHILGLVAPLHSDDNVPVVLQIVASVVARAREHGYDVLLLSSTDGIEGLHRVGRSSQVDGLIVTDVMHDDARVPALRSLVQPSVLVGMPARSVGISCVDLDFAQAGMTAVDELADLGHRDLAVLGPPVAVLDRGTGHAVRFREGAAQAAQRRGVQLHQVAAPSHASGVGRALDEIFAAAPQVTGLIVHNEGTMAYLRGALAMRRRTVPADLSVLTVCPNSMVEGWDLPWTNIDVPTQQLGEMAVDMVLGLVEAPVDGSLPLVERRLLSPVLHRRQSIGVPAGNLGR